MRLLRVNPAVEGLNYIPLLRDAIVRAKPSPTPALLRTAALAPADRPGAFDAFWRATRATARRMSQRVVAARMAQAQRLIESETRRLFGRESGAFDRDAIGSRYY